MRYPITNILQALSDKISDQYLDFSYKDLFPDKKWQETSRIFWSVVRDTSSELLIASAIETLRNRGFIVLTSNNSELGDLVERLPKLLTPFGAMFGRPLRIFLNYPFWISIPTNPNKESTRSGGIGRLPYHVDVVNAAYPPEYTMLFCSNPDPAYGGINYVCAFETIWSYISEQELALLSQSRYHFERLYDIQDVGGEKSCFPVIDDNCIRYSALLSLTGSSNIRPSEITKIQSLMTKHRLEISLQKFDTLILDNRIVAHSRGPLGKGWEYYSPSERRHVYQSFFRYR
jgi:Taurine catabolism dioxygenase TauD, TfdA family